MTVVKFIDWFHLFQGTNNVIEACISANVPHLIFTSTVDVSVGYGEIINADESLPYPEHHLYKGYGTTKQEAEEAVLAANGRPLANGQFNVYTRVLRKLVCLKALLTA